MDSIVFQDIFNLPKAYSDWNGALLLLIYYGYMEPQGSLQILDQGNLI